MYKILTINPGSTSTKIAVFEDDKNVFQKNLQHSRDDLKHFQQVTDQYDFRKNAVLQALQEANIALDSLQAVVGRGGMLRPIPSGVYEVNELMKKDLLECRRGEHASNLGALIADDVAKSIGGNCRAFIADPVVVDELQDVARVSGHPAFERVSIFHALNQKAIAKQHAKKCEKKYEEMSLVVVHLGGGISIGAHKNGQVIDVNNALGGEGPFSPERAGSVPCMALVELCYSKQYTKEELSKMLIGQGGLIAHMGTNQFLEVEKAALQGDQKAALVHRAMAYGVAKYIGEMAVVLLGKIDGIILTGGIAHNPHFVKLVVEMIDWLAPVSVYPGEDEMAALAWNGLTVLKGETTAKVY